MFPVNSLAHMDVLKHKTSEWDDLHILVIRCTSVHYSLTLNALVDPGGFRGFRRTPFFRVSVLCSHVRRSYTAHARLQGSCDGGTTLFRFLDPPLNYYSILFPFFFIFTLSTQDGDSALTLAARRGHSDVVVKLVKAGASLDLQNNVRDMAYTVVP